MATSVQHRGETAVLGLGVESRHHLTAIPSLAQTSIPSSSSSAIPLRDSASLQEARLAARGIARRKLRRRENGELEIANMNGAASHILLCMHLQLACPLIPMLLDQVPLTIPFNILISTLPHFHCHRTCSI